MQGFLAFAYDLYFVRTVRLYVFVCVIVLMFQFAAILMNKNNIRRFRDDSFSSAILSLKQPLRTVNT